MAKSFVVIKNGTRVVDRFDTKQAAEAYANEQRDTNPQAIFEFGKLDKRMYTTIGDRVLTPVDEVL